MAIAMLLEFDGGTMEQYDAVLQELQLGGKPAPGGIFHVAGKTNDGFRVIDVWESQQDFDRFFQAKLQRAMQNARVPEPRVTTIQVHNHMSR